MDTFAQMRAAVRDDMSVGASAPFYNPDLINRVINRAKRKAEGLFLWPKLKDAVTFPTDENKEYYDQPDRWRPHSIFRLEVDGVQYGEDPDGSPMAYEDYLEWRNNSNNTNSTAKKWSVDHPRIFIYPVPTTDDSTVSIWGYKAGTPDLSADGDTTIFSYSMPECNEALVLEAVAILKAKGDEEQKGAFRSTEAKQILSVSFAKIQKSMSKYEKAQPFFQVPDYFRGGRRGGNSSNGSPIGNF